MKKKSCCEPENKSGADSLFNIIESESESDNATESCCGIQVLKNPPTADPKDEHWVIGTIKTPIGPIYRVTTEIVWADRLSTWKVRWGMNRMGYAIRPGIYAVGNPDSNSDIFVSANYKMSFDRLRANLSGVDGWILVLDTRGVNVWCAAGKGTFGTDELIGRVKSTRLSELSESRRLILPQLGAPGISGYAVKKETGFRVKFGPVRACDIPQYLHSDKVASKEMRRVRFPIMDRLVLIPVEIVSARKYLIYVSLFFVLFGGVYQGGFSFENILNYGLLSMLFLVSGFLAGAIIGPLLLPWLPGRSFSSKGAWAGILAIAALGLWHYSESIWPDSVMGSLSWLLLIPSIASFVMMNFTGSSTYTSYSGVVKEMYTAVRLQAAGGVVGLGLWIAGRFA